MESGKNLDIMHIAHCEVNDFQRQSGEEDTILPEAHYQMSKKSFIFLSVADNVMAFDEKAAFPPAVCL